MQDKFIFNGASQTKPLKQNHANAKSRKFQQYANAIENAALQIDLMKRSARAMRRTPRRAAMVRVRLDRKQESVRQALTVRSQRSRRTSATGASGGLRFIEAGEVNHHQCSQKTTTQNQMPWVPAITNGDDANGHDSLRR